MIALLSGSPTISAQDAKRYTDAANKFVACINAADYAGIEKLFSKEMAAFMPPEQAKAFFKYGVTGPYGKIQKIDQPNDTDTPGWKVFLAHAERAEFDLRLALNEKNEIAGFTFTRRVASSPEKRRAPL